MKTYLESTSTEFIGGHDVQISWSKLAYLSAVISPSNHGSSNYSSKRLLNSSSKSSSTSMIQVAPQDHILKNNFLMMSFDTFFQALDIHSMT